MNINKNNNRRTYNELTTPCNLCWPLYTMLCPSYIIISPELFTVFHIDR